MQSAPTGVGQFERPALGALFEKYSTGCAVLTLTKVKWSLIHAALTPSDRADHLIQMAGRGAYSAVRPAAIGAMQMVLPLSR